MNFIMRISKKKFTLLELLVVMIVCLILLAISAPAFLSMSKGQSVDIAARNFGSQLKAARSYAITNRKYTALILPTTEDISNDYLYKSYRACIVDINNNFEEWIPNEKWEFLPRGTAILEIDSSSEPDNIKNFSSAEKINDVDFSSINGSSNTDNVNGIIFLPSGKCLGVRASGIFITIGDAVALENGVSTINNYLDINIDSFSGRVSFSSS